MFHENKLEYYKETKRENANELEIKCIRTQR